MSTILAQHHSELSERVADAARRHNVPGVAVGLLLDGQEDYVCHGITSVPNPLPIDEHTLFQIGSTTKTYTATAIMVLVERGLLELDAPVRQYIPDLRLQDDDVAANVTVLNLLNHTAGWSGDFFKDTGFGDDALALFIAKLSEARQDLPLGKYVSYNNAALSVAGRIIEVVTGQTYEAAIQTLLLDPLGLHEHFFFPWDVITRRFAIGHTLQAGSEQPQIVPWYMARSGHPAGSNFASSIRDQLGYARFHLGAGAGVLRPDTLTRMRTQTTPAAGPHAASYGISWHLRDLAGVQIALHGGTTFGHESAYEMVPARGFAIAVLTNAGHGGPLHEELIKWVYAAYLGLAENMPEPLALAPAALAEYEGVYEAASGTLTITVDGDRLLGVIAYNPAMIAELVGPDGDFPPPPPFSFKILPDDGFIVVEGEYTDMRGPWLRDPQGDITGLNLGGRVMLRTAPQ